MSKHSEIVADQIVSDGQVVSLAYSLRLDDGEEIDAAGSDEPLVYLHGAGNIIPGLESELTGMKVGESKSVKVDPKQAYGEVNPDSFELVSQEMFPPDMELEEGMGLRMVDNSTGQQIEAYVAELKEDGVLLDLNHPLAGETLFFDVEVVGLRPATSDETDHGHVHGEHSH